MDAEVFHTTRPEDPYAWQRVEALAENLSVTVRTIRNYVKNGRVEKTRGAYGKTYYRLSQAETEKECNSDFRGKGEAFPEITLDMMIALKDSHVGQLSALQDRITEAKVKETEFRVLAQVATRDYERVTREAIELRRELSAMKEKLSIQRELSQTAWWAFARRRTLQARLKTPLLEAR